MKGSYMDRSIVEPALLFLQLVVVAFLWLHDWVPLGRLNDVAAVRSQDTLTRLIGVTIVQSVPWSICLISSAVRFGRSYPHWLQMWLWGSYIFLVIGVIRAWWIPYFLGADERRITRYRIMFRNTHSFLPERNGIVPNTAHILLLAAAIGTLITLFASDLRT
jgi:hypothetical protein